VEDRYNRKGHGGTESQTKTTLAEQKKISKVETRPEIHLGFLILKFKDHRVSFTRQQTN